MRAQTRLTPTPGADRSFWEELTDRFIDAVTILVFLVGWDVLDKVFSSMGLGSLYMPLQYGTFVLELAVMVISSARRIRNMRLISIETRYRFIYLLIVVFFLESMIATNNRRDQFVSCFRFSVMVLFATWICTNYTIRQFLELFERAQIIFVALMLGYTLLHRSTAFSSESGGSDFIGAMATKNTAAGAFGLGILLLLILYWIRRDNGESISRGFLLLLGTEIVLELLCHSTGAILDLLLGVGYLLFYRRSRLHPRIAWGVTYIVVSVGFLFVAMSILPLFAPFFEAIGKDATLTGRTILWRQIIAVMTQHRTLIGYGYTSFWRNRSAVALIHTVFRSNSFFGTMDSGAHNVLLELWLNVGLIGIAVYFLMMIGCMFRIRELDDDHYLLVSALMIHLTLNGLMERSFGTYDTSTMLVFLAAGEACVRPAREWKRRYNRHAGETLRTARRRREEAET